MTATPTPNRRIAMNDVVLYSATGCPLCARYRTLLHEKGVEYLERNTTEQPALLDELARKGVRMVPTIFVGDKFVAGFRPSSLLELLNA
jgi:glutaredoxin